MNTPEHQIGQMSVTLGGKDYTLFFDFTFVSILQNSFDGKGMGEIFEEDPIRVLPVITLAAIKAGDDVNQIDETLTERQVSRLLFAAGPDVNKAILDNFSLSMGFIGVVYGQATKAVNTVAKAKPTK